MGKISLDICLDICIEGFKRFINSSEDYVYFSYDFVLNTKNGEELDILSEEFKDNKYAKAYNYMQITYDTEEDEIVEWE